MIYSVREMTEGDISKVAELETRLFSDSWSKSSLRSSLAQENVKMIVAVSEEKQILGYHIFYMSLDEGDVARIAVHPEFRRLGIGEQLLEWMWNYCREVEIVRVLLEVRESNASAIALYQKHGFISLGMRKGYYKEPLENGVIMEKTLVITTSN